MQVQCSKLESNRDRSKLKLKRQTLGPGCSKEGQNSPADKYQPKPIYFSTAQCCPPFEQLGPGARFSKIPKLYGRISGEIIFFVSSKRRRLEARNFAVILTFIPLTTYHGKDQLDRMSTSEFYEWLFGSEQFSELQRNGPQALVIQRRKALSHGQIQGGE